MWPETAPVRFIIWGLEHYRHTHSYIHYAFMRAAKHNGWDVEWVIDTPANAQRFRDCDNYLFLTVGVADRYIPMNPNAFYVLHNVNQERYTHIPTDRKLILQVYTVDVDSRPVLPLKDRRFEFWQPDANTFYAPWATDLLPHEIDENIRGLPETRPSSAVFLGTVCSGEFGNIHEITRFKRSCEDSGWPMSLITQTNIDQSTSVRYLQAHSIAPSIVGTWQKGKGYIPCRIFKTISYGLLGCTNSRQAHEVVDGLAVYTSDEAALAKETIARVGTAEARTMLIKSMELVRDKHTYINRLDSIQHVFRVKQGLTTL
jgi:hypothetical protein